MRTVFVFAALLVVTSIVGLYTSLLWSHWALVGRTFASTSWWWSPLHLLNLADEFALLLIAGTLLGVFAPLRKAWLWGLALGTAFAAVRLSLSRNWFSPDVDFATYFWAYSEYYVSPIGAVIGALLGTRMRSKHSKQVVA